MVADRREREPRPRTGRGGTRVILRVRKPSVSSSPPIHTINELVTAYPLIDAGRAAAMATGDLVELVRWDTTHRTYKMVADLAEAGLGFEAVDYRIDQVTYWAELGEDRHVLWIDDTLHRTGDTIDLATGERYRPDSYRAVVPTWSFLVVLEPGDNPTGWAVADERFVGPRPLVDLPCPFPTSVQALASGGEPAQVGAESTVTLGFGELDTLGVVTASRSGEVPAVALVHPGEVLNGMARFASASSPQRDGILVTAWLGAGGLLDVDASFVLTAPAAGGTAVAAWSPSRVRLYATDPTGAPLYEQVFDADE